MSERVCPLRSVPEEITSSGDEKRIWEPYIPVECRTCITLAQGDKRALREEIDTSELARKEYGLGPDDEITNGWHDYGMNPVIDDNSSRVLVEAAGIGDGRGSHETYRTTIHFDCYAERLAERPARFSGRVKDVLPMILYPEHATQGDGNLDSLVPYIHRLMLEGNPEVMVVAVEVCNGYIQLDEKGRVDLDSQRNEEIVSRLLAMVADMPVEIPIEQRLLVWQRLFTLDKLQAAEHIEDTAKAIQYAYDVDPLLVNRLEGVLNAVIVRKLKKISTLLGQQKIVSLDDLQFGQFGKGSVLDTITHRFPAAALTLYESIAVLETSVRPAINQMNSLTEIQSRLH